MTGQTHKYQNYIVFDFETGGLNANQNPATEIAVVILNGNSLKIIGTYTSLIKPYNLDLEYNAQAAEFTGITKDMCENEGQDIKTVVSNVIDLIKSTCPQSKKYLPLLVGHNVCFDINFLQQIFAFTKNKMQNLVSGELDFFQNYAPYYFDTQRIAMAKYAQDPKMTQHTLGACIERAGLEHHDAHKALPDTIATAELFITYLQNLRVELQVQNQSTTSQVEYFKFD